MRTSGLRFSDSLQSCLLTNNSFHQLVASVREALLLVLIKTEWYLQKQNGGEKKQQMKEMD